MLAIYHCRRFVRYDFCDHMSASFTVTACVNSGDAPDVSITSAVSMARRCAGVADLYARSNRARGVCLRALVLVVFAIMELPLLPCPLGCESGMCPVCPACPVLSYDPAPFVVCPAGEGLSLACG